MDNLRLSVTRTWGNRTLDINSKEWRKLRQNALEKYNYKCRFCGTGFSKYLICDHIDGRADNNDPNNLGINCKLCDNIRHCGRSGMYSGTIVRFSKLSQTHIVRKTYQLYQENGKWPTPNEIDPDSIPIKDYTFYDKKGYLIEKVFQQTELSSVVIANILLKYDYDELSDDFKNIKGFFSENTKGKYLEYIK